MGRGGSNYEQCKYVDSCARLAPFNTYWKYNRKLWNSELGNTCAQRRSRHKENLHLVRICHWWCFLVSPSMRSADQWAGMAHMASSPLLLCKTSMLWLPMAESESVQEGQKMTWNKTERSSDDRLYRSFLTRWDERWNQPSNLRSRPTFRWPTQPSIQPLIKIF